MSFFDDDPREEDLKRFLEPDRTTILRNLPLFLAGGLAVLTVLGLVLLRPTGALRPDLSLIGVSQAVYDATVVGTGEAPCTGTSPEDGIPCQTVDFRLDEGPDTGEVVQQQFPIAETSPFFDTGDRVVLDYQPEADLPFRYNYLDRQRRPVLLWVTVLFAVVVVALGRLRGLAALAGLLASVVVLLQFVIPAIIDGRSPVWVATVGAAAIAFVALYAAHGFNRMTTVALLGTLAALGLTAVLSSIAVGAAHFTGFTSDESFLLTLAGSIDIGGLVLAGIVLGAVGAIDDVTVTQASAVWELHRVRPDLGRLELFRSGLRVGRDHVASTVNTLLLAYAGAAMPLLLFFVLSEQSLGTVLNREIVAVEVLRTLVGSIGLVSAVPLTTWLAAALVTPGDEGGHGH
jgi:uncharacterized membrane protein